jgi:hypothetical protein
VVVVSMGEVSVVVSTAVAVLEAESAAVGVESASAEHTSQVALGTLPAEDPGFLHLVIHRPGSLSMMDDLIDRFLPTSRAIVTQWFQPRVPRGHFRNAD